MLNNLALRHFFAASACCVALGSSAAVRGADAIAARDRPGPPPARVQAMVGVWQITNNPFGDPLDGGIKNASLSAERQKDHDAMLHVHNTGGLIVDKLNQCVPMGMPGLYTLGVRIEANSRYIMMIGSNGPVVRLIWLDRKTHRDPKSIVPSFGGESIGHWEGDTLVVDTIGLRADNSMIYAVPFNDEQTHIVERIRMTSPDEIDIAMTIESPKALSKPWQPNVKLKRAPVSNEMSFCDAPVEDTSTLNLTPPAGGFVPPGADQ